MGIRYAFDTTFLKDISILLETTMKKKAMLVVYL